MSKSVNSVNDDLCGYELSYGKKPSEIDAQVKGRCKAVFVDERSAVNATEGVVCTDLQLV